PPATPSGERKGRTIPEDTRNIGSKTVAVLFVQNQAGLQDERRAAPFRPAKNNAHRRLSLARMERQDLEASKTTVEQSEKLWQCIRSVDHRERAVRRRNASQELHPTGKAACGHRVGRRLDGMPRTAPAPLDM